jgi:hypothetical protein
MSEPQSSARATKRTMILFFSHESLPPNVC